MASNNSSKTAHVMNLLSKNRSAESEIKDAAPETTPAAESAPAMETAPAAPQAPILTSINEDAAVSSQIKDALEAELSGEAATLPPETPGTEAEPSEAEPAMELTVENQVAAALEAEAAPAPSAESQARFASQAAQLDENSYVNVMQILVEERATEYMEKFGLCTCDRCKADVRAYALNHLPPKYVFMGKNEMVPRLTVYESKYNSEIVAQILNACRIIMETPHHTR